MSLIWFAFLIIPAIQALTAFVQLRKDTNSIDLLRGYLTALGATLLGIVYGIGGIWPPLIETTDLGKWMIVIGTIGTTVGVICFVYARSKRGTINLFWLSLLVVTIGAITNVVTFLATSP